MKTIETITALQPIFTPAGEGVHLSVLGDDQLHTITTAQTGGLLSMFVNRSNPGFCVPPHVHQSQDEAFYVLEGSVEFTIDGQRIVAEKGATLFAPRGLWHTWRTIGETPSRMVVILTPGGDGLFRDLDAAFRNTPPTPEKIGEVCARHDLYFVQPDAK